MNTKREEKALFGFKRIMEDLMHLLGTSVGAKTGYMYWVNRSREQFVLETKYTTLPNVMFQDRVSFHRSYLERFKDIDSEVQLEVGRDISRSDLSHYFERSPIHFCTLIPFRNNGETVAITVVETEKKLPLKIFSDTISAYKSAHVNVLNTYLEITDLYEEENKWVDYENSLKRLSTSLDAVELADVMMNEMQKLLPDGGISVSLRGMETWVSALRTVESPKSPSIGMMVEEKSMAYESLQKGEPIFSMHFNQNPKRISSLERDTAGATLAIPMMIASRRHGVILAHHHNPLVFTESLKHQLVNFVKIAALTIEASLVDPPGQRDLYTTEYGNFVTSLVELSLKQQLQRQQSEQEYAWFGLFGIGNLEELRARLRLDDLKKLQRLLVKALNPSRLGYNGFIGFNSDYVYSYMFLSHSKHHHDDWLKTTIHDVKNKMDMGDGREISVEIYAGFVQLHSQQDAGQVIAEAKKALGGSLKKKSKAVNQ